MPHGASIAEPGGRPQALWETSPLLAGVPGLVHGFTTRAAGDLSAGPPPRGLPGADGFALRLLRQVHGCRVASPSAPEPVPEADGWAGRPVPGVLLGILTADCVPVLLCHPPSRTLGLAHAGWRGIARGVVTRVLKAMGVPAEEVWAAVGPAIGPCCYRVGPEVVRALGPGGAAPWPGMPGRYREDLGRRVRAQLERAGVPAPRIDRVGGCTACHPERYFSHRARGETGRLLAFAGWAPEG